MRYHSSLIKHYISINDSVENIAQKLILKTCEVEETIERKLPDLVVIGKVLSVRKHPQADKLVVCELFCGEKGNFTICTGGENVVEGSYVAVALPGCHLPVINLTIEPRKLRGEDTNGMICSKGELGINEDEEHHWIWTLQYAAGTDLTTVPQQPDFDDITDADCGIALKQKYPRLEVYIYDVDNKTVTHRPDMTGHFGLAWELHAMYAPTAKESITWNKLPSLMQNHTYTSINEMVAHGKHHTLPVHVDCDAVSVYSTLLISWCTIKPSNFLTRMILIDCDSTPKNNWVDLSNYFMLLTGQPVHCFDADTIEWWISVRYAKNDETFVDLKDTTHTLTTNDIVICDDKKILALGGIIGGKDSAVSEKTKNVLVEVAHFDPVIVRKTGTRLALRTDAELRFEKHINPQFSSHAIHMFLDVLQYMKKDIGEHTIEWLSYYTKPTYSDQPKNLIIAWDSISQQIYGDNSFSLEESQKVLINLGFTINENTLTVPRRRSPDDINGTHDIIEEVVRIYGYESVSEKPLFGEIRIPKHEDTVHIQHVIEDTLSKQFHMDQCETYPWLHERYAELFGVDTKALYQLQNPAAPEIQHLKDSMIYGLLDVLTKNYKTIDTMNLFDTGKVWIPVSEKLIEQRHLGVLSYTTTSDNWQEDTRFRVKQAIKQILDNLNIQQKITYTSTTLPYYHTKKQCAIYVGDTLVWTIWSLHPRIADALKLPENSSVTFGALHMDILAWLQSHTYTGKYETQQDQILWRDFSFVMDKDQNRQTISDAIAPIETIHEIRVFDLYAWDKLPEWKKSIAFSCKILGDGNMTSDAINTIMQQVIQAVETTWASLR